MSDIVFETTVMPDAYPYVAYEASIAIASNASAVTAASVSSGSLPPGLSIATDHVRITGTVSAVEAVLPKVYTFKVTLTDTAGAVQSGTYTITVREPQAAVGVGGFQALPVKAQMAAMWPTQF